jgi:quercetin dioxygenase-like cupin family protein
MNVVTLDEIEGRRYPAGRLTQSIVGAGRGIECDNFCMGVVSLDAKGGQVPWHNHPNEEVYLVLEGELELALGDELATVQAGQTVHIPSGVFHQLTNLGQQPARFLYVYAPAGDVAHWRQELDGTLRRAGADAPPLPAGAAEQRI